MPTLDAMLQTMMIMVILVATATVVAAILYFAVAMILHIHERWLKK